MRIEKYAKKKNEDGTDYIDPITNDFVTELVEVVIIETPIEQALEEKSKEIDDNTERLIRSGFSYKGVVLSMSQNAQTNWGNILNYPEEKLPKIIFGKDDKSFVSLNTKEDLKSFYYAALNFKDDLLTSGKLLIIELNKLKDVEQILNFKDDRL